MVASHDAATTDRSLLATKLLAPVISPRDNATSAMLDNGRTRSMQEAGTRSDDLHRPSVR